MIFPVQIMRIPIHFSLGLVKIDYFYTVNRWELCINLVPNRNETQSGPYPTSNI